MEKAILIPANPKTDFEGGPRGNIAAYEERIKELGAVFWRLVVPGDWAAGEFPHPEIRLGYLYDVAEKMVTHVCDISWIKPMSDISYEDSQRYSLGKYDTKEEYDERAEAFYIFHIPAIRRLEGPRPLSSFHKFKDGQPVKLVRNYCIVQDPIKI